MEEEKPESFKSMKNQQSEVSVRELRRRVMAVRYCQVQTNAKGHEDIVGDVLDRQASQIRSAVIDLEMKTRKRVAVWVCNSITPAGRPSTDTIVKSWVEGKET